MLLFIAAALAAPTASRQLQEVIPCVYFKSCRFGFPDWPRESFTVSVDYTTTKTDEEAWAHVSGPGFFNDAGFTFNAERPGSSRPPIDPMDYLNGVGHIRVINLPSPDGNPANDIEVSDLTVEYVEGESLTERWFRACGAAAVPFETVFPLVQEFGRIEYTRLSANKIRVTVIHEYCAPAENLPTVIAQFKGQVTIVATSQGSFFGSAPELVPDPPSSPPPFSDDDDDEEGGE